MPIQPPQAGPSGRITRTRNQHSNETQDNVDAGSYDSSLPVVPRKRGKLDGHIGSPDGKPKMCDRLI